jgi:hypothetical protein
MASAWRLVTTSGTSSISRRTPLLNVALTPLKSIGAPSRRAFSSASTSDSSRGLYRGSSAKSWSLAVIKMLFSLIRSTMETGITSERLNKPRATIKWVILRSTTSTNT